MLKFFKLAYSSSNLVAIQDLNLVQLLTQDKTRTLIDKWEFDSYFERMFPKNFAINYAYKKGDRSPFLRGFQLSKELQFEILDLEKRIVPAKYLGRPFYDMDKTEDKFMFEGTIDEFLDEFRKEGYQIPEIKK